MFTHFSSDFFEFSDITFRSVSFSPRNAMQIHLYNFYISILHTLAPRGDPEANTPTN